MNFLIMIILPLTKEIVKYSGHARMIGAITSLFYLKIVIRAATPRIIITISGKII